MLTTMHVGSTLASSTCTAILHAGLPSTRQGVKQRAQGAGQAAMRKGLGRGAFICGVRRSLDPSTSVEGLLVAGVLPILPRDQ